MPIICRERIAIGDDCLIGTTVSISDHNHGIKPGLVPRPEQGSEPGPLQIVSNDWLDSGVIVCSGVAIDGVIQLAEIGSELKYFSVVGSVCSALDQSEVRPICLHPSSVR